MSQTWVVLLETVEEFAGDPQDIPDGWVGRTWLERIGTMEVPLGTRRATVYRRLFDGQGERAAVPQIAMAGGERATVHLVPAPELEEGVEVTARVGLYFDVVS